jgi:hypothetical protein
VSKRSWIIPLVVLLVAAGLLFALAGHWTEWEGDRAAQRTDDAYLRADMTPPQHAHFWNSSQTVLLSSIGGSYRLWDFVSARAE